MALFLLKECDRMRYFLNVLWDYKIEDTYEKTKKMLLCRFDMKRQKCLITLKARIQMYWSVFYVCKSIRWKNHVLSCPSTIVNLFFTLRIDISLYR